jgi:putative redox protein
MIKLQKADNRVYRQRLSLSSHEWFADTSAALGGDESAPEPHDLFDSSLAACTAITLTMYAKRKGMPLDSINIDIERDNSKEKSGEYGLALTLEFIGNLTDEQKQQLLTIATKCPIHKLMSQATITISHTLV